MSFSLFRVFACTCKGFIQRKKRFRCHYRISLLYVTFLGFMNLSYVLRFRTSRLLHSFLPCSNEHLFFLFFLQRQKKVLPTSGEVFKYFIIKALSLSLKNLFILHQIISRGDLVDENETYTAPKNNNLF